MTKAGKEIMAGINDAIDYMEDILFLVEMKKSGSPVA